LAFGHLLGILIHDKLEARFNQVLCSCNIHGSLRLD
jgi:hypothetical protein